jgi:hypothetical protein
MPDHETATGGGDRSQPPHAPDPDSLSRRELLKATILGGGALLTVGGSFVLKHVINDHERHELEQAAEYADGDFEREELADRDYDVKQGMRRYWQEASVWPGLAILPPDVQLFGTVMLDKDSEIAWPKGSEADHLAVQRPFMVLQTLKDEGFVPISGEAGDQPPLPGVMSFWMPDSQQIAFCDQQAFSSEILMPTNSNAPIYESDTNYNGIVGENVHLEPAVARDGLTYRYLQYGGDWFGEDEIVTKVCGRSIWANLAEVATAYTAFETGQGTDLVQLPGAP